MNFESLPGCTFNDFYNIPSIAKGINTPVNYSEMFREKKKHADNSMGLSKLPLKASFDLTQEAKDKKKCIVVVPLYKKPATVKDIMCLKRTINVFDGNLPIMLLCPYSLDTDNISQTFNYKFSLMRLSDLNFRDKNTYSAMMIKPELYSENMLGQWEYTLIVQTDAYIFGSAQELDEFYGHDYVGAPWSKMYVKNTFGFDVEIAGNGGLSLRKNVAMNQILQMNNRVANRYASVED